MKITAIIAEYNPFHLGHKYHIEEAKRLTNADIILVIMSGNFVQRGEPAIYDKYLRTKIAIENGADIVLELPYPYSCSSAEYFATAAVTILNKLNCVDYLCFGSECNSIEEMTKVADILINEPLEYQEVLKEHLKSGVSFPKAREAALKAILSDSVSDDILSSPNNILGIEYIKGLKKLNSKIKPVTIKRMISSYHHSEINDPLYSASSIRKVLESGYNIDLRHISKEYCESVYDIVLDDFSSILASLLVKNNNCFDKYFDISSDLSDRITNNIDNFTSISDFITLLKSKNTTYTSISRAMCHILLGLTNEDMKTFKNNGYADYVRVLGFNNKGSVIFKLIEDNDKIETITKMSKANEILLELPEYNRKIFDYSMYADILYRLVVQNKFKVTLPSEYQHPVKF